MQGLEVHVACPCCKNKRLFDVDIVPEGSKILDVFSGTSAIGYALKDKYEICANDAEIFCKNIGETLLAKDGYLINLYKKTGGIVQMLSIGHAPYSACVIRDNYLFVGGGEPPVNGLLRAFLLNDHSVKNELEGHYEFGNFIENEEMEINIVVDNDVEKLIMDASVISTVDRIKGKKIGGMINFKEGFKQSS